MDDVAAPSSSRSGAVPVVHMGDVISQCAESRVYACTYNGASAVCKHRFAKQYRHPVLDKKLREQRTMRESRALARCAKHSIAVPEVYSVDKHGGRIFMEKIRGVTVKAALDALSVQVTRGASVDTSIGSAVDPRVERLLRGLGEVAAQLHNADIIHGDLTTSNFICTESVDGEHFSSAEEPSGPEEQSGSVHACAGRGADTAAPRARAGLYVIDFGLVAEKHSAEERAVDLYVLERAITATHPFVEEYASSVILAGYLAVAKEKERDETMKRLTMVRARGRKRSMVG